MLEFRFHGRGGQGVVILSKLVARLFFLSGKQVKEFPKFGVERRGAPVEGYVRVDDVPIDLACQVYRPDAIVVMAESILDQVDVTAGLSENALILVNTGRTPEHLAPRLSGYRLATVDASAIALDHGLGTPLSPIANTALFGAFARLFGFEEEMMFDAIRSELKRPDRNIDAAMSAYGSVSEVISIAGSPERRAAPPPMFASLDDLPELAYSLRDASGTRTGAWRSQRPSHVFKTAPCNATCPAGNDVRGFLEALGRGSAHKALEILLRTSPFPGVCGRVCPHPCEEGCNRKGLDEAVAVMASERYAEAYGGEVRVPVEPPNGLRVAIVGAGPAGLSAAWQLARWGYAVSVYDQAPHPGGMLLLGIPSFRLPRDVLDREVARIVRLGVTLHCGTRVGTDIAFEELLSANDSVILAVGRQLDRRAGIPGEDLPGVEHGLAFLRRHNLGEKIAIGRRVVVVGGGNTAIDVAGVCLRGSRTGNVTILYRRTRAQMPAISEEVDCILNEGARLIELQSPVEILKSSEGRVSGIRHQGMRLAEDDDGGRPRPVPVPGSLDVIASDHVIFATGQATDSVWPEGLMDDPRIVPCGDVATQDGTVASAIGSGRRAAEEVRLWHQGIAVERAPTWAPRSEEVVRPDRINLSYFRPLPRGRQPRLAVSARLSSDAEVVGEIEDGCAEARRCFSCGTCSGCDNCFIYCPEPAVTRSNGVYTFDDAYCKGCGVCYEECPRAVIEMREDGP
jgi:2-oxoacid:acceptor oxidoreductase gamma subunit (pyruvate/2-ketoisovalerate family)